MKILKAILFILILSISLNSYAGPVVKAKQKKDRVSIHIDGKLFTEYKFSKRQKYPYFYPVNGPATGKSITTETSEPYPHHHSLFFGCDHVSGGNYWQDSLERGQIISESIKMIKTKGESIEFRDECVWKRPGAPCPFKDTRIVKIYAPSKDTRFIDFTITLQAEIDVTITKTNHSLFSARVMPELSVKNGGTMINSHGKTGEKGTWGNHADWIDYGNTRDGVFEGIAIFCDPNNRWHPPRWFTRDYGFFSPTPMNWLKGGKLKIPKGKELTLHYGVYIHQGDHKKAEVEAMYKKWVNKN